MRARMTRFAASAALFRALRTARGAAGIAPAQCRKFLFLQYEYPLGAAVMATPVFEALKKALPDASIAAACGDVAWQVLKNNPHIDTIVHMPSPVMDFRRAWWQFVRRVSLAHGPFDCVVTDAWNQRTWVALLTLFVRAKLRLGFTLAQELYDLPLSYDAGRGTLTNNLRIVEALGHACGLIEPAFFFNSEDAASADSFMRRAGIESAEPVVAMTTQTSGGFPEKRSWRGERFAVVADHLVKALGCKVIFLGMASEAVKIETIRARMTTGSVSAAGAFSLSQLAAALTRCDLLLTLDTGALHVARAVGLPSVVIARPWQPEYEWLPVGLDRFQILVKPEIVAEERRNPEFAAPANIDEISADEVIAAVGEHLLRFPPSPAARSQRRSARVFDRA